MSKDKMEFRDILKIEGVNAKGFGIIPKLPMLDRKLTIEAKAIYAYFKSYAGAGTTAFPGRDKICADLGISVKRYYKHFNLLKEYGYITVEQSVREDNKYSHNIYTLVENPIEIPRSQNDHTEEKPCSQNEYTQNEYTQNDHNINNRSLDINNRSLYNQSVIEADGQTDIETEKETIIEQAQVDLYKGDHRELLEKTIDTLLRVKEIKVNDKLLNSQQIREQLNKLHINIIDFTFSKFRQAQAENEIKNKAKYFQVLLLNCIEEYSANNIN